MFGASNPQQGMSGTQNTADVTKIGLRGNRDKRTAPQAKVTCRRPAWSRFRELLEALVCAVCPSMGASCSKVRFTCSLGLIIEQVYAAWTAIMLANVSCGCKGLSALLSAGMQKKALPHALFPRRHVVAPAGNTSTAPTCVAVYQAWQYAVGHCALYK